MSKSKKDFGWIGASLTFGVIMLFVYLFVSTNKDFQVVYTQEHLRDGYETMPAGITVYGAAFLKWAEVSATLKMLGWICLALTAPGNFIAWKYDYKFATLGTPWARISLCMGPVLLCAIFWLASYSSRLDLGAYTGSFDKFRQEFQISDEQAATIIKEGGSGTLLIQDENGKLTEWFKANRK